MANDTCPHCGAERSGLTSDGRFACGTLGGSRSPFCYSQQLETVTAERDELRRRIDEAPVYVMVQRRNDTPELFEQECEATRFRYTERVRLVRDDQPIEDVPESSQRNP